MVDIELYKIFKIVADEENLTRASEKLNISQPAVTKHIHNLENQLNIKLFTRTRYGMVLTEDGKKIYSQIKDPIRQTCSVFWQPPRVLRRSKYPFPPLSARSSCLC